MDETLRQWVALCLTPNIPVPLYKMLVNQQLTVETVLENPELSPKLKRRLTHLAWDKVNAISTWLNQNEQHQLLPLYDPLYPKLLTEIHDPPPLLYLIGDKSVLNSPQIAMVGTRHPSPSGRKTAHEYASELAERGYTVTSGLAIGIDTACHEGALTAGKTIAVLGSGLSKLYPKRNINLSKEIATNGCLISEFSPEMPPLAHHFPRRNRIISGLATDILVIEATLNSGSLITARLGLEQNRNIYACPGNIHHPQSEGCHHLIKQGAYLLDNINCIHGINEQKVATRGLNNVQNMLQYADICTEAKHIYRVLGHDPQTADAICAQTAFTIAQVLGFLTELELQGCTKQVPGGYVKTQ